MNFVRGAVVDIGVVIAGARRAVVVDVVFTIDCVVVGRSIAVRREVDEIARDAEAECQNRNQDAAAREHGMHPNHVEKEGDSSEEGRQEYESGIHSRGRSCVNSVVNKNCHSRMKPFEKTNW